ncbi:Uncharacterised protein [Leclercia adecarboxylata]|uniref:Uncharacterized protein n=1 Tax=Leclercia adecarboxylata TaxID=83655 RepID=A0A4U9I3B7_9ENTR|nr:Uncharacterised protein [Leclercia adecarboxylata]
MRNWRQVDVHRRDAHQVEDGRAVDRQNAWLVAQDFCSMISMVLLLFATISLARRWMLPGDFQMVEVHRQKGTGDLQIEGVQGVMRICAAVSYISAISVGNQRQCAARG